MKNIGGLIIRLPRLTHEVYAVGGQLIINPVGVEYVDETKENLAKFTLPSTQTAFGSEMYGYIEDNYRAALPQAERLGFARKKLEESVQLASTLEQQHIDKQVEHILANYDSFGLPKNELFSEVEFSPEQKRSIAAQYVDHSFGERLSQPVRKVFALSCIMERPEKDQLCAMVGEYASQYQHVAAQPTAPELVKGKMRQFTTGLDAMCKGEHDVRL